MFNQTHLVGKGITVLNLPINSPNG